MISRAAAQAGDELWQGYPFSVKPLSFTERKKAEPASTGSVFSARSEFHPGELRILAPSCRHPYGVTTKITGIVIDSDGFVSSNTLI
jgi:hypothetical protein